jgi:4-hydroxy-2-oxoheptanedioate aldolase
MKREIRHMTQLAAETRNTFKENLRSKSQIGIFLSLGGDLLTECFGLCGFDWVMIDTEHSPNELDGVVRQLQVLAASPTHVIVRPAVGDAVLIKRLLDIGVMNLLIPDVRSAEQAAAVVRATRYPPNGIRGVSGNSRASRFGLDQHYADHADQNICVIIQIESVEGLERIEDIAGVPGVDVVFIGAADLAASMGRPGQSEHADVQAAVDEALATLKKLDVPSGYLGLNKMHLDRRLKDGISILGVATDTSIVLGSAIALRNSFISQAL